MISMGSILDKCEDLLRYTTEDLLDRLELESADSSPESVLIFLKLHLSLLDGSLLLVTRMKS